MANEPYERPFILQWRSAVLNSPLGAATKLVLLVLAEYADVNGADCYPSLPSIARLMSANERTVRRNLDPAIEAGYIQRSCIGKSSNGFSQNWKHYKYELLIPTGADTLSARASLGAGKKSTAAGVTNGHRAQNVWTFPQKSMDKKSTELASKYEKASMDKLSTMDNMSARVPVTLSEAVRKLEDEKYMVLSDLKFPDLITPEAASAKLAELDREIAAVVAKAVSA
ncbi:hypothetical protein CSC74_03135 [Pseudoxanthomonas yeongjuensis]|uniref:helix-turn-helix domain-containing protein n=1 Tax=Pseudoxanthomonas yeongjuensis TaxID=377616 RepID=UPI001390E496|nr:helix-turn-helix domain-containing protein [Pseudoxanthomonas yeongjuensis]KAF1717915.1 hypothetical protein CSC74_03135 [Pseudoxanthomonas yeongjuensis]